MTEDEQFADLPDSKFACIIGSGDDKQRKLPIPDAAHTRNAMARYNQTQGCQTPEVKAKICSAARKFGIDAAFEKGGFCYKGESQEEEKTKMSLEEKLGYENKIAALKKYLADANDRIKELAVHKQTVEEQREQLADLAKAKTLVEGKLAQKDEDCAKLIEQHGDDTKKTTELSDALEFVRKQKDEALEFGETNRVQFQDYKDKYQESVRHAQKLTEQNTELLNENVELRADKEALDDALKKAQRLAKRVVKINLK